jgi:hypothetical protein
LVGVAIGLSLFAHVPYIFSLLGFSALPLLGHLVTIDEDLPGGWSNLDGSEPFPWVELLVKAVVFAILCAIVILYPQVRSLGA